MSGGGESSFIGRAAVRVVRLSKGDREIDRSAAAPCFAPSFQLRAAKSLAGIWGKRSEEGGRPGWKEGRKEGKERGSQHSKDMPFTVLDKP